MWGIENWGEMTWSGAALAVPVTPIEGLVTLAILLVVTGTVLTVRSRLESRRS